MSGVPLSQIRDFLVKKKFLIGAEFPPSLEHEEVEELTGIETANAGSLSWASSKFLNRTPDALKNFAGLAIIVPGDVVVPQGLSYVVFRVLNSKLSFSWVAREFFGEDIEIEYAASEADFVRLGISIAATARLAPNVVLGRDVRLSDNVTVGPHTVLANCKVGRGTSIGANCTIGLPGFGYERDPEIGYVRFPHIGGVNIGADVEIGSNTCIDRGALGDTEIADGVKIDNLVHVAHNVKLGAHSVVIANSMVAGSVTVGEGAWLAPSASIRNQLSIGPNALVGLGAVVIKNVPADTTVAGNPAAPLKPKEP